MGFLREYIWKDEYKYHDSPTGEDCFQKLWYVTKYCGIYGVLGSTIDVLHYSKPKGYPAVLGRFAYITLPFMGMGAAFVATSCISANIRQKDDKFNYAMGGIAIGAVSGAWKKSVEVGVKSSIYLAVAAIVYKDLKERGWPVFVEDHKHKQVFTSIDPFKIDFTITKDPGKDWKSSTEI